MSKPPLSQEETDRIQPFDELRKVGRLLDASNAYDPNENYPFLNKNELAQIIEWSDDLPENRRGGHRCLIHKTTNGRIGVSEIARDDEGNPCLEGKLLLEVEREPTGDLRIVFKSSDGANGRTPDQGESVSDGAHHSPKSSVIELPIEVLRESRFSTDGKNNAEETKLFSLTGGKDQNTQWVHGEFIVSSETIRPPHTQWVHGEFF